MLDRSVVKNGPEMVRSSLLPFFVNAADDLTQVSFMLCRHGSAFTHTHTRTSVMDFGNDFHSSHTFHVCSLGGGGRGGRHCVCMLK